MAMVKAREARTTSSNGTNQRGRSAMSVNAFVGSKKTPVSREISLSF